MHALTYDNEWNVKLLIHWKKVAQIENEIHLHIGF
jgi:hypothetical protein